MTDELDRLDSMTEELATRVIGAAIEVHRVLGPGFSEAVYKKALAHELTLRQIPHLCEVETPVFYKGSAIGTGFIDILVGDLVILELKVVETLTAVHRAQVISYLHATGRELGLLINFNVAVLKDGLKRVILTRSNQD